jgi:hypothetical protein
MSEASTTLNQKAGELATAIEQTRGELARRDDAQRSAAHRELARLCNDATAWLERLGDPAGERPSPEAASLSQEAERFLHDLRTRRSAM